MQFNIYKGDRPSDGARALQTALGATMLRTAGSRYTGRKESCVINWGSTSEEAVRLMNVATAAGRNFFNSPRAVARAVNKLDFFRLLAAYNPQHMIPWADNVDDAVNLVKSGGRVFARTVLSGHSGKGIELMCSARDVEVQAMARVRDSGLLPVTIVGDGNFEAPDQLRNCRLFTQAITGKRVEYRVHVVKGTVILTQAKLRKEGFEQNPKYNSIVRNVDSGWIYSVNNVPEDGREDSEAAAIAVISELGLDFGAVDIVYQSATRKVFILEVNTAPGLSDEGSALEKYNAAFRQFA